MVLLLANSCSGELRTKIVCECLSYFNAESRRMHDLQNAYYIIVHLANVQCHACLFYAGRSLHFEPSVPEIRVDSGNDAVLQCVLGGNSTHVGSFSWTGPAIASSRAVLALDSSGTVSTLNIASVGRSDEGQYSCSYTGVDTVFISLDVNCKLPAKYRLILHFTAEYS